ncbi:unnamed protein product [Medioppia subpectinata]|uniref:Uncharacterized protein n=1 Tax=Medioppia subpectinata TaxID=1979941 RepID=A0A7R9KUZ8_9ACAR|nr:unnamed protein product [Medioppia subpectinata]CAG2109153.1 unnamed protein product [Medioppia subpectinata]
MPRPVSAQSRNEQRMQEKAGRQAALAKDPIERLRLRCLQRGASGILGLGKTFRIMDDNQSGDLTLDEFTNGLRDMSLDVTDDEISDMFKQFDRDGNGAVKYDEFLKAVRPPMNKTRLNLIDLAFKKMDKTGDGVVTLDDLKGVYNTRSHPEFQNGQKTEKELFEGFLKKFEEGGSVDGMLTKDEFTDYYSGVSASIDEDIYFDLMMRQLLGVTRESTRDEISREYRKLARKWHPDLHRGEEAKAVATDRFRQVANAYEVLKEEESRRDYDYMVDNPDEMYAHYYRYYRRMYAPKVDVRIVIVVTISIISGFQYYAMHSRYKEAIDYFLTVPKYKLKAQDIAKTDGLLGNTAANRKKNRFRSKDDIRIEEENVLRKIIEEKMDIKGGYSKPSYRHVLWVQLAFLPHTIVMYLIWYFRWIWKYNVNKEEFGDEEKKYIIRKSMSLSQLQWEALTEEEIDEYMEDELWIKEKFDVWKRNRDDEQKAQLAESSSYKRYRRYLRKGGPGQMTFLED